MTLEPTNAGALFATVRSIFNQVICWSLTRFMFLRKKVSEAYLFVGFEKSYACSYFYCHPVKSFYPPPKAEGYCSGIVCLFVLPSVTAVSPESFLSNYCMESHETWNKCALTYCSGASANFVRIDLVTPELSSPPLIDWNWAILSVWSCFSVTIAWNLMKLKINYVCPELFLNNYCMESHET